MGTLSRACVVVALAAVGCGGGNGVTLIDAAATDGPPSVDAGDPPRAVTTTLRRQGFGPHCLDFETGAVTTCPCTGCAVDVTLDGAGNFSGVGAELTSVGLVADLASVGTLPASGYTASAAANVGEGYVLRTSDHNYYRIFVERFVLETGTGGVIGLSMKWAPFDCSLYSAYKCDTVAHASGVSCAGLYPDSMCSYAACSGEYLDCDDMADNGCELDGSIAARCLSMTANATGLTYTCADGCDYAQCTLGALDCDGNRMNGCELVVATRCASTANATPTYSCQTSTCDYTTCTAGYQDCDGDRMNGCELQGTGCPILLATGSSSAGVGDVVVSGSTVYFVSSNLASVSTVSTSGGTATPLNPDIPNQIGSRLALDATNVYFTAGMLLDKVPRSGGAAVELRAPPSGTGTNLVIDATHAYFSLNLGACCGEHVRRVPLAGGGPEQNLADGPYYPFALDATDVYALSSAGIVRIPKGGGSPVTVQPLTGAIYDLISDGTYYYWTGNEGTGGIVKRVPVTGGTPTTLLSGANLYPRKLAVDGTHVYFFDALPGNGLLRRVPVTGGASEVLASNQGSAIGGIAFDATNVYWSSGATGRILKLAK